MATGCAKEALTAQELWTNLWEERHSFRVTRDLATAIFLPPCHFSWPTQRPMRLTARVACHSVR